MPRLIIDGQEIEVPLGTKVIEAAERLGIMIPRFCYHEALGAVGACRMCAVKFLQGPFKGVQMSCMIDAQDGMVVSTTDEEAVRFRKAVIEWLMLNHPHDCPVCDEGGQCLLQDETVSSGHGLRRYPGKKRTYRNQYLGIFIAHEMNRCIHCYRCSRFYQDFSGYRDLGTMQISNRVYFGRFRDGQLESPFSGNLVDICPTGVYTDKTARFKVRRWQLQRSPSVCIHCSLGCNTIANANYRGVMRIEARANDEVNGHFICDPGRFSFSYTNGGNGDHEARPWFPRVNNARVPFEDAARTVGAALAELAKREGSQAVACLGGTRSSLETQTVFKRFSRAFGFREPNFYLLGSLERKAKEAVSLLDESMAASMHAVRTADFVVGIGVDPINEAPMLGFSIRQSSRRESPVVMIDPRPIALPLEFEHLAVTASEMESCLEALVTGALKGDTPGEGQDWAPGLTDDTVRQRLPALATGLARSRKPVIVCGMGIVKESTPALAADLTRRLRDSGKEAGIFYLIPGANGFTGALLAPDANQSFEDTLDAVDDGRVKALVVVEADPCRYYPDKKRLERALEKLDYLVVLDHLPSETVRRADAFLPTSTVFETSGTYVNQEGRAQLAQAVHKGGIPVWGHGPPREFSSVIPGGEHRPGWACLSELTRCMDVDTGEAAWVQVTEHNVTDVLRIEMEPFPGVQDHSSPLEGTRILPVKGSATGSTTARSPMAQAEEPFQGETGIELLLVDWLYGTEELMSYSADMLSPVTPDPLLTMHPDDASQAGLSEKGRVLLELEGGSMEVGLLLSSSMARRTMLLPRHWGLAWQKTKGMSTRVPLSSIRPLPLSPAEARPEQQ